MGPAEASVSASRGYPRLTGTPTKRYLACEQWIQSRGIGRQDIPADDAVIELDTRLRTIENHAGLQSLHRSIYPRFCADEGCRMSVEKKFDRLTHFEITIDLH